MHKQSVKDFDEMDPETFHPQTASDLLCVLSSAGEAMNHYADDTTYDSFRERAVEFLCSLPENTWLKVPEFINIDPEASDDIFDEVIKEKNRMYSDIQVLRDLM